MDNVINAHDMLKKCGKDHCKNYFKDSEKSKGTIWLKYIEESQKLLDLLNKGKSTSNQFEKALKILKLSTLQELENNAETIKYVECLIKECNKLLKTYLNSLIADTRMNIKAYEKHLSESKERNDYYIEKLKLENKSLKRYVVLLQKKSLSNEDIIGLLNPFLQT